MSRVVAALRNEWRVVGRHPLVWLAVIGATLFSAMVVRGSPADPADGAGAALRWLNLFYPMFILPFVAGALAPLFFLRETDHGMDEIVGSYPLTQRMWLAMRVGSFFLILLLGFALAEIAFCLALLPGFPGHGGKIAVQGLGWLLLVHAPTSFVWASLMALVACRKANSGLLYFAAAAGWLAYIALATLSGTPMIAGSTVAWLPLKQAMILLDPYAATALLNPMPAHGLLHWREANVAAGRLVWLLAACLMLWRITSLPSHAGRGKARTPRLRAVDAGRGAGPIALHLRFVLFDKVFALLVIGWVVLLLPEVLGGMDYVEPFSELMPDSNDALNRVMWDMVSGVGALLLLYVADRVCRLYAATRMAELYAATPHRPHALVMTQLATLWVVAAFFVLLAAFAVLIAQCVTGSSVQLAAYGAQGGLVLSRLLVQGALLVAIHGLVRNRFVANLVGLALIAMSHESAAFTLGLAHPLWRPVWTPLTAPDRYWGYGGSLAGHWQFLLLWTTVAVIALVLAIALHHRELRFAQVRLSQISSKVPVVVAALLVFAVYQGSRIDAGLRAEGALVTSDDRDRWRAEYERGYRSWEHVEQPEVAMIATRVDFFPKAQRARIDARLQLVNRGREPITRILIGRNVRQPAASKTRLDNATVENRNDALGQTVFRLAQPLLPGGQATLHFATDLEQSGLSPAAVPIVLRRRFNALPIGDLLPVIGFEPRFMLRDEATRRKQGLPPVAAVLPSRLPARPPRSANDQPIILDSTVSTEPGNHVVAQGTLLQAWQAGGRSYTHYRTPEPIHDMPAYFSVPWAPSVWRAGDHEIRIFAPGKVAQTSATLLGAQDTLAWLDRDVAPYPSRVLNLVATPEIGLTGFALPEIVELSDRVAFEARPTADAGFDQAYRRAAHEVAHQWFGHQLGFGIRDERAFLVESLAKYAELVMVERRYGRKAARALVAYELERYRQERIDPQRPVLALVNSDDGADMYSRATLAFACLRSRIGDGPIVQTLRELAKAQRSGLPVRSLDFVERLSSLGPPAVQAGIRRLFLGTEPIERSLRALGCHTADP